MIGGVSDESCDDSRAVVSDTVRLKNLEVCCLGLGVPSVSAVKVTDFRDVDDADGKRCIGTGNGTAGTEKDLLRRYPPPKPALLVGMGGKTFRFPAGLIRDLRSDAAVVAVAVAAAEDTALDRKMSPCGGTRGMPALILLDDAADDPPIDDARRIIEALLAVPDKARPVLWARQSVKC